MADALITGSCNCGRHKYTIPKATRMNLCHCIDCRKWAGSMYSAHILTKTEDVQFHDSPQPKTHTMKGDGGKDMERAWCDNCGCGIWIRPEGDPNKTFLKAGLFEPHEIPNPTTEVYLKNKEEWETPALGTERNSQTMTTV